MKKKFYKWTVEIQIAAEWVADGADLTSSRMHDIMTNYYSHLYSSEIKTKTIKAPTNKELAKEQGYRSVKEFLKARKS